MFSWNRWSGCPSAIPFSIHPILVYLEKKKYEVFNLRALARGKESKLPSEKIAEYLVM
ncbi:MAG: V-type ATPase subunit [Desulfobacterales bacterium]|nr:V-type ATPase subunit [Desulfobacterales bacterium]